VRTAARDRSLSTSCGALRILVTKRAARAIASGKTLEKRCEKICDEQIFASARAALFFTHMRSAR